jgi:predicted alpha/beta-hydrolase family hydrolase
MTHASMTPSPQGLAAREVATLRFQFRTWSEARSGRPARGRPGRGASPRSTRRPARRLAAALRRRPLVRRRMTSQSQPRSRCRACAASPSSASRSTGRPPGTERAAHLSAIEIPMLFPAGHADELATLDLLNPVVAGSARTRPSSCSTTPTTRSTSGPAGRATRRPGARGDARRHRGLDGDHRAPVGPPRAARCAVGARVPLLA